MIQQKEFAKRRKHFIQMLGKSNMAVLPGASIIHRNSDVEFPFRQESSFYYLTGFDEPDAVAVFIPGRAQGEYILFCKESDAALGWKQYRAR